MSTHSKKAVSTVILYLVLIVMVIVSLFPILFCLSASLRTQEDLFQNMFPFTARSLIPTKATLENYVIIFTQYDFLRPIVNTLVVTLLTILFGCLLNSLAAFAYTCFDFHGRKLFYILALISFMVPFEAIAIPLYSVANSLHMVDTYAGMIVPAIADGLVIFLFIQFFKDFPVSLLEAARVDGASWVTIFFRIVIPISVPIFVTAGLMIFMNQWNSYMWPLLVARSKDIRTIQIAISQFSGERSIKWTYIYAASMISAIIPIGLFLPFQKYFVEGITAGSVKG
jgi:ABC-type glycerol-3-phosphate transport system permease component